MIHDVSTNKFGREYLASLDAEFIGVDASPSNESRNEKSVIIKWPDGKIGVVVVPNGDSINKGCCVFGDLKYFATLYALEKANIPVKWLPNGNPLWPAWYAREDDFREFKEVYDSIIEDFSK